MLYEVKTARFSVVLIDFKTYQLIIRHLQKRQKLAYFRPTDLFFKMMPVFQHDFDQII